MMEQWEALFRKAHPNLELVSVFTPQRSVDSMMVVKMLEGDDIGNDTASLEEAEHLRFRLSAVPDQGIAT